MEKITLEKTHGLLEKLAEYVMNEVPRKSELNELRTDFSGLKTEFNGLRIEVKEVKEDVKDLKQKVNIIITVQDKQAKQLDEIKTELVATNSSLLRHDERITFLEQNK